MILSKIFWSFFEEYVDVRPFEYNEMAHSMNKKDWEPRRFKPRTTCSKTSERELGIHFPSGTGFLKHQ